MRNVNPKDYKHIIPQERINLTIAALARGDLKEADSLWDTCPRYDYRTIDLDYAIRIHAFTILSMAFREKCLIHYSHIERIESNILLLEYLIPEKQDIESYILRLNRLDKLMDGQIAKLKGVYRGLKEFCGEVGLCYEHILQTAYIDTICPNIELYLSHTIDTDVESVEQYKIAFSEFW